MVSLSTISKPHLIKLSSEKIIFVKTSGMKLFLSKLILPVCILLMIAVGAQAQYITTFAGTGYTTGYSGDGGQATNALMYAPSDITFDDTGNLYITDFIN